MINFDLLYPKPKKYGGNDKKEKMISIRASEKSEKLFRQLLRNPHNPNAKPLSSGQLFEAMVFHYKDSMLKHFEDQEEQRAAKHGQASVSVSPIPICLADVGQAGPNRNSQDEVRRSVGFGKDPFSVANPGGSHKI